MKTINLNKYAGDYSLVEAKKVLENIKADIFEAEKLEAISHAEKLHGSGFTYELCKGTSVDLRSLNKGQQVCASGIKGHHILMTEK